MIFLGHIFVRGHYGRYSAHAQWHNSIWYFFLDFLEAITEALFGTLLVCLLLDYILIEEQKITLYGS